MMSPLIRKRAVWCSLTGRSLRRGARRSLRVRVPTATRTSILTHLVLRLLRNRGNGLAPTSASGLADEKKGAGPIGLAPSSCPYSPECVEKLSKKSLGGVSSVRIAGMTQQNRPRLLHFGGS